MVGRFKTPGSNEVRPQQRPGVRVRLLVATAVGSAATTCAATLYLVIGPLFGPTAFDDAVMFYAAGSATFFVSVSFLLMLWPWERESRGAGERDAPTIERNGLPPEWTPPQEPVRRVLVNRDCGRCMNSGRDPHGERLCLHCDGLGHRGQFYADLTPGTLDDALMRYALACEAHALASTHSQEEIEASRDRRAALAVVRKIRGATESDINAKAIP